MRMMRLGLDLWQRMLEFPFYLVVFFVVFETIGLISAMFIKLLD